MESYQTEFIQMAIEAEALCFGNFVLKSGRTSPYFFNAGKFQRGSHIAKLGEFYAKVLVDSGLPFDMIFGPAYKGIPLATAAVATLAEKYGIDVPYSYNRKEAKDHGEGGILVGAPLVGNVVIVDDVITAGTAVREVLSIIEHAGAKPACIIVGLNREEKGKGEKSAIDELQETSGVRVMSIVNLSHIMQFLEQAGNTEILEKMASYRKEFGTK